MKVLHVALSMSVKGGGPPRSIQGLTLGLAEEGVRSHVVHSAYPSGTEEIPLQGTTVQAFATSRGADLWRGRSVPLRRHLMDTVAAYDLVHIHELWHHPGDAAAKAALHHGIPYIISPRGALDSWVMADKGLRKAAYMRIRERSNIAGATAMHALTDHEAGLLRTLGVGENRVFRVPNGITIGHMEAPHHGTSGYARCSERIGDKPYIAFLGRIHKKKGLDIALSAFALIAHRYPDLSMLIAGSDDDGLSQALMIQAKELGVAGQAKFLGPLYGPAKERFLRNAEFMVLPSRSEGFTRVALEALSVGCPAVLSHQCYFPEAARAGCALEVPLTPDAFANAFIRILESPRLAAQMGAIGPRLIEERYSWTVIARAMRGWYERIAEMGKGQ